MEKLISYNINYHIVNYFTTKEYDLEKLLNELNISSYYELTQVHGNTVNIVDDEYKSKTEGDALITNLSQKALIIRTADCIPVLIYDEDNQAIGVVHSGWKGTLNDVVGATIDTMVLKYHSKKENLSVYLYPSIRKCHFEIGEDVFKLFQSKIKDIDKYTTKIGIKYYLDLQNIIIDNLRSQGINKIYDNQICTYCHHDKFHSYRYNHTEKRNYLLVMIKE